MPGETLSLRVAAYPNLEGIAEGDDVTITGRVVSNDGETVQVETADVQSEMGGDKMKLKQMSAQPGMETTEETTYE